MASAQQNFDADQAHAQSQERANQSAESAKLSASVAQYSAIAATDKAVDAAHTSGTESEQNKEEAAGFIQQTAEQVKNMAQGAVDSVKHSLGMDKQN